MQKSRSRKPDPVPIRRAQLVTDVVSVLCPWCSEPQPNPDDGSEQWTIEHFRDDRTDKSGRRVRSSVRGCVSCDGRMLVDADPKVRFE